MAECGLQQRWGVCGQRVASVAELTEQPYLSITLSKGL